MITYHAAGKLMLFGEYLVLNGSKAVAFPLKFGQELIIEDSDKFFWESFNSSARWFFVSADTDLNIIETNNRPAAELLLKLMKVIKEQQPSTQVNKHFKIIANFDLSWGLGSSSTLISLLSQWSSVNAEILLKSSFGGSGYDVACATANHPLIFKEGKVLEYIELNPAITDCLLFIYLGKKQSSREEIIRFKKENSTQNQVDEMNAIIDDALSSSDIETFEKQILRSETLISSIIHVETLKSKFFADYPHEIKSLGAWGGDFFMATFRNLNQAKQYFISKGYSIQFTYKELIK